MDKPRTPHLALEREGGILHIPRDGIVVLDASRTGDYLECPESYRRKWEGEGYQETSKALEIGTEFHALIAEHIRGLIRVP